MLVDVYDVEGKYVVGVTCNKAYYLLRKKLAYISKASIYYGCPAAAITLRAELSLKELLVKNWR